MIGRRALLILAVVGGLSLLGLWGLEGMLRGESSALAGVQVEERPFRSEIQAEGILEARSATVLPVPRELRGRATVAWMAADGSLVAADELLMRFDPSEMERRLEEGQAELRTNDLEAEKTRKASEAKQVELEVQRRVASFELGLSERFQKTDEVIFSRHEIIESAIDRELAQKREHHAEELQRLQGGLDATELDLLEIQRRSAERRLGDAQGGLKALELRAPHGGVLQWNRNWQGEISSPVGAQVYSGQPLAEIDPLDDLQAQVYVLEADAGGLAAGARATVVVEAYPRRPVAATVLRVEPVAQPRNPASPVQYFGVVLALERFDEEIMKPGQRVRARLVVNELDQALVVPRQAVFSDDQGAFVYRREDGRYLVQRVALGPSSTGLTVVAEGLDSGDWIALEAPAELAEGSDG
ncbi:MAG: HlyD family efflux transporter periplasmic adaptor subunit [Acidobacteriota bacterium]